MGRRPSLILWMAAALELLLLWLTALDGLGRPLGALPSAFFFTALGAFLPYLLAVYVSREKEAPGWKTVFLFALLFRLPFYFLPPVLSDDIFRYVWDGRVQAAGINPYLYAPNHLSLLALRDAEIWPAINHPELATPYPPAAQVIFFLVGSLWSTVFGMKLVLGVFDFAALFALFALLGRQKEPPGLALVYAWNPLIILEYAWSGHIDAAAVGLLVVSLYALIAPGLSGRARILGGFAFGAAVLVKYLPLLALPALWWRGGREARRGLLWGAPLALLFVLPYLNAGSALSGSLGVYTRRWHFNDSVHALVYKGTRALIDETVESPLWAPLRLLRRAIDPQKADKNPAPAEDILSLEAAATQAPPSALEATRGDRTRFARFQMASYLSRGLMLLALLGAIFWGVKRRESPWEAAFFAFGGFLAFAPTVHPWYATWGVPFLVRREGLPMLLFSATVLLSYHVLLTSWKEKPALLWLEYLPVALCLAWVALRRQRSARALTAPQGVGSLDTSKQSETT